MFLTFLTLIRNSPIFANSEVVVPKTSKPVILNPVLSPDIAKAVSGQVL